MNNHLFLKCKIGKFNTERDIEQIVKAGPLTHVIAQYPMDISEDLRTRVDFRISISNVSSFSPTLDITVLGLQLIQLLSDSISPSCHLTAIAAAASVSLCCALLSQVEMFLVRTSQKGSLEDQNILTRTIFELNFPTQGNKNTNKQDYQDNLEHCLHNTILNYSAMCSVHR